MRPAFPVPGVGIAGIETKGFLEVIVSPGEFFLLRMCNTAVAPVDGVQGVEPEGFVEINDGMAEFVSSQIATRLPPSDSNILVLGLTFKKNVPDLRNSLVARVIHMLRAKGHSVEVHDPHADPGEAQAIYGIELLADLSDAERYDCVVGAVAHDDYKLLNAPRIAGLLHDGGLLADVAGMWRSLTLPPGLQRWQL